MWIKSPRIEFAFQITGDGRIVVASTGPRFNVEGTSQSSEAQDWQYLADGIMQGQLFTAQVYNEGNRVMVLHDLHYNSLYPSTDFCKELQHKFE